MVDTFSEEFSRLNEEQKKAVQSIEGPVLVIAGPGSGKTQILSMRVGQILRETDTSPSGILCLTFTESAAVNMRERLESLIGREAYRVAIHTFHNFGTDIIQNHPEFFFGSATFSPADDLKRIEILEHVLDELTHDDPLRAIHPVEGYVYLSDIQYAIGYLKNAGVRPEEFIAILEYNKKALLRLNAILSDVFCERLTKSSLEGIRDAIEKIHEIDTSEFPSKFFHPLEDIVVSSLKRSYDKMDNVMTPLSEWKKKWLTKDENGKHVLKDTLRMDRLISLSGIYKKYQQKMYEAGFYDFDDMLLDAIQALEENPILKYELQERFQYILIDEFQDTNDAQMRIIHLLSDNAVNEGRPNVMAVGDDDQAIYRFQGADVSNILDFKNTFRDPEIIFLTKNYRSTQNILDIARSVIVQGEERLENLLPEMEKVLVASNADMKAGDIVGKVFPTDAHEKTWVAQEIRRLIDSGENPSDIAIISRKHKHLETLVPYLKDKDIPLSYERSQNVFREPHIQQLIIMARFVDSLLDKTREDADEYLPEILAFPFWRIDRKRIWEVSVRASKENRLWLDVMEEYKELKPIAHFFMECGAEAKHRPLEYILDVLVGSHVPLVQEDENDEDAVVHQSPFKSYYFSEDRFTHEKSSYLSFLSSLRVFMRALREYRSGEILKVHDLIEFVDLHEKNNLVLTDQNQFTNADKSVQLLTAHKAKGLEFGTVFILSCQNSIWAGRGRPKKLSMPVNMPIEPPSDSYDDKLRLFYVALTRAKKHLYLTRYEQDDLGKESSGLEFLVGNEILKIDEPEDTIEPQLHDVLTSSWFTFHSPEFSGDEKILLGTLLTNYQMSVTHLNNFLDIVHGGPQKFLEHNLLRFPQAKSVSAAYGSAIHRTFELIYGYLKRNANMPGEEVVLGWFESELYKQRLSSSDFRFKVEEGKSMLTKFLSEKTDSFNPDHLSEVNFKNQGVVVDGAHLSGKIDKIVNDGGMVAVCDYKTGKAFDSWEHVRIDQKPKVRAYERQLLFYKLLMNESRDYCNLNVVKGVLEFVHPKNGRLIDLELEFKDEDVDRLRKLIKAVHTKIMNIDFPDIGKYTNDMKGILMFEDDLINETI